ncbi:hypothetical protein Fmac_026365 [Flemingia macrophylla]|uniref:Uncharacterized protein n=1 Tax=Flemingia macrophylla TaxID=520843 RepID=A0ABD1LEM8_9FABA
MKRGSARRKRMSTQINPKLHQIDDILLDKMKNLERTLKEILKKAKRHSCCLNSSNQVRGSEKAHFEKWLCMPGEPLDEDIHDKGKGMLWYLVTPGPPFTCLASLVSPSLASSSTSTSPQPPPPPPPHPSSPHITLHPSPLRRPPPSPSTLYSCRLTPLPLHRLQRIIVSDTQSKRSCFPKLDAIKNAIADIVSQFLTGLSKKPMTLSWEDNNCSTMEISELEIGWGQVMDESSCLD